MKKAAARHCMVVHAHYPVGETRVEREAHALIDHGIEVDVICLKWENEASFEVVDEINVYRLPLERHKGAGLIPQLLEYLAFFIIATFKLTFLHAKRHYNVIQVHNLPDWLVFVSLFPKITGARVILDLHDLMPEFFAARFGNNLHSLPLRLLMMQEQISCWFADHVLTVTESWRETLIQRGVPAAKVSVVMNVADDRIFHPMISDEKSRSHNGHFQLLYHGNLTYQYGIDILIHAVEIARLQIPNIHLYIHGWGDTRQELIELTDKLNLKEYVGFSMQGLYTSNLPGLIGKADVCIVPYRVNIFTEGILPTKLMEYAAMEMPVIAAHTPTIARYFDETMVQFFQPGNVQDLANCLCELYAQPERLAQLSQGIDLFNQEYNWSKLSIEYVRLVENIARK